MSRRSALTVCVLSLLLSVGSVSLADDDEDFATWQKSRERGQVQPDKALVYIVRPATMGTAIRFWAFADDEPIGITRGNTYTFVQLEPGTRLLWSRAENISTLELDLKGGETYFVKQKVKMGGLKARVKLELLSVREGHEALDKCEKLSKLTEAGLARAHEIVAEKYDKAKEKSAD